MRILRRSPCSLTVALVTLVAVAAVAASAQAQPDPDPASAPSQSTLSCGVVHARADMAGYYSDLCGAFVMALDSDDPHVELPLGGSDRVLRWLVDGSVELAIGLAWEGTGSAPIRHGPVVLVMPFGRFGLAAPQGEDRLLETASWLFHALVQAEAWGIDRAAVIAGLPGSAGERFRAYEAALVAQLGLEDDALRRMIADSGHHGEIWSRHFGAGQSGAGEFSAEPGPNRPVELGGLLYAPPVHAR